MTGPPRGNHNFSLRLVSTFGKRAKRGRFYFLGMEDKSVAHRDAMKGELDRRVIYGGKAFTGEVRKKYEIQEVIRPKGRPKKRDQM
jgi:hypothetical protein